MRELEFLPQWYPRLRRRKRIVALEGWLLFVLIVGLGAWTALVQRNVHGARTSLASLNGQLEQMHAEQRMLDEQLALRKELQAREQLIGSLGFPVEMTRLLQTLDAVMPKEMSLLDFSCETEEQASQSRSIVAGRGATQQPERVERRLRVRVTGIAPSDLDLANFLAGLTNTLFFEQVAVTYARDKRDAGHILREFEVTFLMELDQQTGN